MMEEIKIATKWWAEHVSEDTRQAFAKALELVLNDSYTGHWYEAERHRGCGYRCLSVDAVTDPRLEAALALSHADFTADMSSRVYMSVSPGEVKVKTLLAKTAASGQPTYETTWLLGPASRPTSPLTSPKLQPTMHSSPKMPSSPSVTPPQSPSTSAMLELQKPKQQQPKPAAVRQLLHSEAVQQQKKTNKPQREALYTAEDAMADYYSSMYTGYEQQVWFPADAQMQMHPDMHSPVHYASTQLGDFGGFQDPALVSTY